MKRFTLALGLGAAYLVAAPGAQAGCTPVVGAIASGCAQIFEDGQVTKFEIDNLPTSTLNDVDELDAGLLTVRAKGDYAPGTDTEFLTVDVDDLCSITGWALAPGTAVVSQTDGTDWVGSWFISSDLLEEILEDGAVEVIIANSMNVGPRAVEVNTDFFSFAISRPATQTGTGELPEPCIPTDD